ncbi:MAG TPA: hypothetical protein VK668_01425 [Mucilaginibacter sp.]|nr:hypothetical protein [Mucilaginibacter sp.]
MVRFSIRFTCFILLLSAFVSSCQKDESVKAVKPDETELKADSALNNASNPGNYLAVKGMLKIKVQDSTYTFNAAHDSIAFVNMNIDGEEYYGITAINKAHTVSFGISSMGAPIAEMASDVSGAQFLLSAPGKTNTEYTLTHNAPPKDYGIISLDKYNQDTTLAKGTFHTYLAKDKKPNSAFFIADGSFELQVK